MSSNGSPRGAATEASRERQSGVFHRVELLWRFLVCALLCLIVGFGHAGGDGEGPQDPMGLPAGATTQANASRGSTPASGLSEEEARRALDGQLERDGGASTIDPVSRSRAVAKATGSAGTSTRRGAARGGERDGQGTRDSDSRRSEETSPFERQLEGYSDPATERPVRQFGYEVVRPQADADESDDDALDRPVRSDYVLGTGDQIVVSIWSNFVDEDYRAVIDRSGQARFPKIGLVSMKGLTIDDARSLLTESFKTQIREFQLEVRVVKLRDISVHVVGRVGKPGRYRVSSISTLLDALARADGVTKDGSLRRIVLRRLGEDAERVVDLYSYLLDGDLGVDITLASGDVIVVPAVGPRVAIVGRVLRPAIYELREETVLFSEVLRMAGGYGRLADAATLQIESSSSTGAIVRSVQLATTNADTVLLRGGDVAFVRESSPVIEDVVYVAGNVSRPGRYALAPGMRVSDVLTPEALVSAGFWTDRQAPENAAREGRLVFEKLTKKKGEKKAVDTGDTEFIVARRQVGGDDTSEERADPLAEYPEPFLEYAMVRRIDPVTRQERRLAFHLGKALAGDEGENLLLSSQDTIVIFPRGAFELERTVFITGAVHQPGEHRFSDEMTVSDLVRAAGGLLEEAFLDEAVLTRVHAEQAGARYEHIPVRLAAALAGDPVADFPLQKDDSLAVKLVPEYRRTYRVSIEGEVRHPGKYTVIPGERLSDLIKRAGGFTTDSYQRGAQLFRESVRQFQQKRLEESLERLERETKLAAQRFAADAAVLDDKTSLEDEQKRIDELVSTIRKTKALGRMVLDIGLVVSAPGRDDDVPLMDGDRLVVPRRPDEVHVVGAVFNQTALLWRDGLVAEDYLRQCGGATDTADMSIAYIIRANGTADSARDAPGGFFWDSNSGRFRMGGLLSLHLYPGDTLVIPYDVKPQLSALGLTKSVSEILFNVAFATGVVIAAL